MVTRIYRQNAIHRSRLSRAILDAIEEQAAVPDEAAPVAYALRYGRGRDVAIALGAIDRGRGRGAVTQLVAALAECDLGAGIVAVEALERAWAAFGQARPDDPIVTAGNRNLLAVEASCS